MIKKINPTKQRFSSLLFLITANNTPYMSSTNAQEDEQKLKH